MNSSQPQDKRYFDYSDFMLRRLGGKVQKIAIDAGFSCPNRDGAKAIGGCVYCNNATFNPPYCSPRKSVAQQVADGKRFFARKYGGSRYLAYFQAYSGTYASIERLRRLYAEALDCSGVEGIVVATRPDCVTPAVAQLLADFARRAYVAVELGIESAHDGTLRLINRCHTWADTVSAASLLHNAGIDCGGHLIFGLPDEDEAMMLATVRRVAQLPLSTLKFHQMQVVRGTRLAADFEQWRPRLHQFTAQSYAQLCVETIRRLPPTVALERFVSQSPPSLLISPHWGVKPAELNAQIAVLLTALDARQGDKMA